MRTRKRYTPAIDSRLYRVGNVLPSDLVGGCKLWLHGGGPRDEGVANALLKWHDRSSHSNHASQGTAGLQPIIFHNASILNWTDVIQWQESDRLVCPSLSVKQPFLIMFVIYFVDVDINSYVFEAGNAANAPRLFINGLPQMSVGGSNLVTFDEVGSQFNVVSLLFDGANSKVWRDNVLLASGNMGTEGIEGGLTLGDRDTHTVATEYFNGAIGDMVILEGRAAIAVREQLEETFNGMYGL